MPGANNPQNRNAGSHDRGHDHPGDDDRHPNDRAYGEQGLDRRRDWKDDTRGWERSQDERMRAEQSYGQGYRPVVPARSAGGMDSFGGDRQSDWQADRNRDDGQRREQDRGFMERAGDTVSSWFGDEDASRRRQQDSQRGKGPKGYIRSDDRIRDDVNDRLSDDHHVDASEIEVSVAAGEVILTGHVPTRPQRRQAEDCVEQVAGVLHVQNNLRVGPPRSSLPQDGAETGAAAGQQTITGATST